ELRCKGFRTEFASFLQNLDGLVNLSQLQILDAKLIQREWEVRIYSHGLFKALGSFGVISMRLLHASFVKLARLLRNFCKSGVDDRRLSVSRSCFRLKVHHYRVPSARRRHADSGSRSVRIGIDVITLARDFIFFARIDNHGVIAWRQI